MKVAIASDGRTTESPVHRRFGRARYFILYDTETEEWSVHDNRKNMDAAIGAGIHAGHDIVALGVDAVLTRQCGTWAFPILVGGGVDVYAGIQGTVRDAIDAFRANELRNLTAPSVPAGYRSE